MCSLEAFHKLRTPVYPASKSKGIMPPPSTPIHLLVCNNLMVLISVIGRGLCEAYGIMLIYKSLNSLCGYTQTCPVHQVPIELTQLNQYLWMFFVNLKCTEQMLLIIILYFSDLMSKDHWLTLLMIFFHIFLVNWYSFAHSQVDHIVPRI